MWAAEAMESRWLLLSLSDALRSGTADLSDFPYDPARGYEISPDAFYAPQAAASPTPTAAMSPPAGSRPFGAAANDTSEFMSGSVYVNVVLFESDGKIDPSTEDWTPTQITQVESQITTGLNWWHQCTSTRATLAG